MRAFFSCLAWRAIPSPLSKLKRRLDTLVILWTPCSIKHLHRSLWVKCHLMLLGSSMNYSPLVGFLLWPPCLGATLHQDLGSWHLCLLFLPASLHVVNSQNGSRGTSLFFSLLNHQVRPASCSASASHFPLPPLSSPFLPPLPQDSSPCLGFSSWKKVALGAHRNNG